MDKRKKYTKLKNHANIYRHIITGKYLAIKRIKGKRVGKSFDLLASARQWRDDDSNDEEIFIQAEKITSRCATLNEVWDTMQSKHFPLLAKSTQEIWTRRFELLKLLGELPMDVIQSSTISSWVESQVQYFKSDEYENNCRGKAKRCNLDNELNLFTTIFNWYKASDLYEHEAKFLLNPVKTKHKKMGFIRPKPIRDKSIPLDDALKFFRQLPSLYQDLALTQYYLAARIGEIAGLQFNRVDFKQRKIVIMETAQWDMSTKTFRGLNKFPKNREPRIAYMTKELEEILRRRLNYKHPNHEFVFHVEGKPLNYSTIQVRYKQAQKKANLPYSGTHILRHGMAKLARKHGGGLDAVIAMTGHKDYKLADHYSKLDFEFQKEVSEKIMKEIREKQNPSFEGLDNVICLVRD